MNPAELRTTIAPRWIVAEAGGPFSQPARGRIWPPSQRRTAAEDYSHNQRGKDSTVPDAHCAEGEHVVNMVARIPVLLPAHHQ